MTRLQMDKLQSGPIQAPRRLLLYGYGGIGKSTLASQANNPLFFDPTGGTSELDVVRVPRPHGGFTWQDLLDLVKYLTHQDHAFQTLVIDELGAIEEMCWAHLCKKHSKANIVAFGYNKGYHAARDEWRRLVSALDEMRQERGMDVILLGHSQITSFKNPEGVDYNRFTLKVHAYIAALLFEWVDAYLLCKYETATAKAGDTEQIIGVSDGTRHIYTETTAAFDAKNRYALPREIPLRWSELDSAIAAQAPMSLKDIADQLKALELDEGTRKKATALARKYKGNARKMAQLLDWAKGKSQ